MPHDDYDHLRESADSDTKWARPAYDVSSVVRMTEAERAAIDTLYPPDLPIRVHDDGETVVEEIDTRTGQARYILWDKWIADEMDRRHRDMMNTRIAIVAIVGIIAGAIIVLAWIAGV